jgi:hypothetical protein
MSDELTKASGVPALPDFLRDVVASVSFMATCEGAESNGKKQHVKWASHTLARGCT